MHAVHERIAVQEQQPTALLGVAVVLQIDPQRAQQIGLVLAIVAFDDVEDAASCRFRSSRGWCRPAYPAQRQLNDQLYTSGHFHL